MQDLLLDQDGIEGERTTEAAEKEGAQVKPDLGSPTAAVLGDDHEPDAGGEQAEDQQPGIVETKVVLQDEEEEGEIATLLDRVVDAASGTYRVTLNLPNPEHNIASGLKCDVDHPAIDQAAAVAGR